MSGGPMTEALSHFINDAGWLAPLYYVLSFVVTALLPFIPTPLVGALGGAALGVVPAVLFGVVGLGLGAFIALNLSRRIGRPIILKLVSPTVWAEWEALLGIRSVFVWGVIFFVLNVDFAVVAAGLSGLPLRRLWLAAMIARLPWLVASAWFGDLVRVSDTVMLLALVVMLGMVAVLSKLRPLVHHQLVRWAARHRPEDRRTDAPRAADESHGAATAGGWTASGSAAGGSTPSSATASGATTGSATASGSPAGAPSGAATSAAGEPDGAPGPAARPSGAPRPAHGAPRRRSRGGT
jgi:uncharacterized membrane protein YdjX (TVP38/TMEM64 family)